MTMWWTYLIPVIAIIGVLVYTQTARKRAHAAMASGQGPQLFHDQFAGFFKPMSGDERIVCLWQGLAYTGPKGNTMDQAKALAGEAARNLVGFSSYTPYVYVALTTHGRVVVSEEYSEYGQRNNYRERIAYPPGASAVSGAAAIPGHTESAPKNPFNPQVPLELTVLRSPHGENYAAWLSQQAVGCGSLTQPIDRVLPMDPARAAQAWQQACQAGIAAAASGTLR